MADGGFLMGQRAATALTSCDSDLTVPTDVPAEELASLLERLGASVLDNFAASFGALAIAFLAHSVLGTPSNHLPTTVGVLYCAYRLTADAFPSGQSLGKRALGISVVNAATGLSCTLTESVLRNVTRILSVWDLMWILGERRRRLGDMVAGTRVIRLKPWGRPA
jgi:uncharacterized RDD family membrane protein YckC